MVIKALSSQNMMKPYDAFLHNILEITCWFQDYVSAYK
jgi:hypothetical protein